MTVTVDQPSLAIGP